MRRGMSSVRGFGVVAVVVVVVVLVLGVLALVALVLGYAMAAGDRELPSTLVRYVLAPLVGGSSVAAVVRWLLAQRAAGRVPELAAAPAGPASSGDVPTPDRSRAEADPPRRVRGPQAPRQPPTSTPRPPGRAREAEHKRRG